MSNKVKTNPLFQVDRALTKVSVVDNIITWDNPQLSVTIDSKGIVRSKKRNKTLGRQTCVKCCVSGVVKSANTSFQQLYLWLVLGIKSKVITRTAKIDRGLDYTPNNILVTNVTQLSKTNEVLFDGSDLIGDTNYIFNLNVDGEQPKVVEQSKLEEVVEVGANAVNTTHYTEEVGSVEYVTEDGAKFPVKELAEWHMQKVAKGKSNAQTVLDYNGGYILAEQIYLNEVVYNCPKPYENFVDVMKNDNGIQEVGSSTVCTFNFDTVQPYLYATLKLRNLKERKFSKQEAEFIKTMVNDLQKQESKFREDIDMFKQLVEDLGKLG